MKYVVLILLMSCAIQAHAQCKLIHDKTDEFTGKREKQTDLISIGRQVWGSVGRTDSLYYVLVSADVGCVSTGKSKLYIKFTDGTVLELTHQGKIDCKSVVTFVSGINDDMEAFQGKTVARARLSGTERNAEFEFKDQEYFKKSLACLK